MKKTTLLASVAMAAFGLSTTAVAEPHFNRVSTFPVYENLASGEDRKSETAAEILAAAKNGNLVIYSDSPMERLGFVNITDPSTPRADGFVQLDGEPTSVAVVGKRAYVGVNTSGSYTDPSGYLGVVDLDSRRMVQRCDVLGQPDSVAASPDGRFVAVAVENERDEDFNDGVIPQFPAGHLASFKLGKNGMPGNCEAVRYTNLLGLAKIAGSDPEPEYVSINSDNIAVVTLQENNHIVLVDLERNEVVDHFSAGTTFVRGIDTRKDRFISLTDTGENLLREPDAVAWLDNDRFVTANEGDYEGGSRSFTVFDKTGSVRYESLNQSEALSVSHGQYPEKRSSKKGTEPEGVAVGSYDSGRYVFVGLERAGSVLVYRDTDQGLSFSQFLPTGVKPEGILPLTERNLLVVANEEDSADDKVRSTVSVYSLEDKPAFYPHILSEKGENGQPIGWGALSGLAADRDHARRLYAVNDSFYSKSSIYTIDAFSLPARIVRQTVVHSGGEPVANLDIEGIAQDADGSFWLASEGHPEKDRANRLLHVKADGELMETIELPDSLLEGWKRFGLEGVAVDGERIVMAVQREWGNDPKGLVKLISYDRGTGAFHVVHYPLDATESPAGGWVGLSEIVSSGNGSFLLIERDNQKGDDARIKRIYSIDMNAVTPVEPGEEPPVVSKTLVRDILPLMQAGNGWTPDKLEGLTVTRDGTLFAVTDNDGVDDASGETQFFNLGKL
ncbi:esterase-like activity of phytase family protein [Kiloniella sp. b19]|uniref:esterase-like activity of phytase family protein n=1 Tax=Kiloniella sp. GXU_MW_B19 TaxID=3141326 RepID=UPI0031D3CD83